VVDLDGDGVLDITLGKWRYYNEGSIGPGAQKALYIRNTNPKAWPFVPAEAAPLALDGVHPDFIDLDGDGLLDAVCLLPVPEAAGLSTFSIGWQKNLGGTPPRFAPARKLSDLNQRAWRPRQLVAVRDGDRRGLLVLTHNFQRVMFFVLRGSEDGQPHFRYFATAQSRSAVMSLGDQAAPFVCDWDGDGDRDLLVGGGYGWPQTVINHGDDKRPAYGEAQLILADGKPIRLLRDDILGPPHCWHDMGYPFPAYVDWDDDGLPDLVLPNETNRIFWYKNVGTRRRPQFGERRQVIVDGFPDSPELRTATAKLVAAHPHVYPKNKHQPFFWRSGAASVDVNRDGLMDLVARDWSKYSFGRFMRYRDSAGALRLKRVGYLKTTEGRGFHGSRVNVVDWDGDGRRDVVFSRATNKPTLDTIFLARNVGTDAAPVYEKDRPLRFFGKQFYITRHGPHPWAGDLDGDGKPDLLCYTEWSVYPFYAHAAIEMESRPEFVLSEAQRIK